MTDIEYAELFERAVNSAMRAFPDRDGTQFERRVHIARLLTSAGMLAGARACGRLSDGADDLFERAEQELLGAKNRPANTQSGSA